MLPLTYETLRTCRIDRQGAVNYSLYLTQRSARGTDMLAAAREVSGAVILAQNFLLTEK